jgi:membrane protein DedA with SNARE-associated domain
VPDFELIRAFVTAFLLFLGEGFGLPIPEEVAIVIAGLWTANQADSYPLARWLMLPVCLVAILIADVILYSFGRFFGTRLLDHSWFARIVSADKRHSIEQNFHRYGVNILLFGRLVPGIRSPLFIIAGTMRLSVPRFVLADGLGAVFGNSLLFFLAFWFGDQFKELVEGIEGEVVRARPVIVLVALVSLGIYLLVRFLRRPVPTGDPEELPIIGHQVAVHIDSGHKHNAPSTNGESPCDQRIKPAGDSVQTADSRAGGALSPGPAEPS